MILSFDFETTTHSKGSPFDSRNFAVSYSYLAEEPIWFGMDVPCEHRRYTDLDFKEQLQDVISNSSLIIGCNLKFDLHWCRNIGVTLPTGVRVWDVQLAEFILSGQTNSFASLNSLAELYGLPTKLDQVKEYWDKGVSTEDIPEYILQEYNNYDVELTYKV